MKGGIEERWSWNQGWGIGWGWSFPVRTRREEVVPSDHWERKTLWVVESRIRGGLVLEEGMAVGEGRMAQSCHSSFSSGGSVLTESAEEQ